MRAVCVVLCGWIATAAAQPVTRPEREPCAVTVALAPAEVRAEIEAWVRAEPRCVRELEVRVVPTDDGLYLTARDARGVVRERIVPDAQSAAVLVVSWMADDSLGSEPPPRAADPDEPTPTETADIEPPAAVAAPGLARMYQPPAPASRRWLTIGAIGSDDNSGVRAQLDLWSRGRWTLGVAGGLRAGEGRMGDRDVAHARIVLGVSHALGPRLSLRAQIGLGADASRERPDDDDERMMSHERITAIGEASLQARVRLADRWALIGGPILETPVRTGGSVSLFFGIQRGL